LINVNANVNTNVNTTITTSTTTTQTSQGTYETQNAQSTQSAQSLQEQFLNASDAHLSPHIPTQIDLSKKKEKFKFEGGGDLLSVALREQIKLWIPEHRFSLIYKATRYLGKG
jgi:hypothetical protein